MPRFVAALCLMGLTALACGMEDSKATRLPSSRTAVGADSARETAASSSAGQAASASQSMIRIVGDASALPRKFPSVTVLVGEERHPAFAYSTSVTFGEDDGVPRGAGSGDGGPASQARFEGDWQVDAGELEIRFDWKGPAARADVALCRDVDCRKVFASKSLGLPAGSSWTVDVRPGTYRLDVGLDFPRGDASYGSIFDAV